MTRLHTLLAEHDVAAMPTGNPDVTGICHDSRRVAPGDLYVAIVGEHFDGRRFAGQAVERGAVAVLGPGVPPDGLRVPWVRSDDPRAILAPLAAGVYAHPERAMTLVGITGTNGKSTVTTLTGTMLDRAGRPAGTLGTLGYFFGDRSFEDSFDGRTTPEAPDLFRTLAAMHRAGARAASMEVSSHALALGRVAGVTYDVVVFTNLTHDHLDFHGDMESYFEAKCSLFDRVKDDGHRVVNLADPYGRRLAARHPDALTYDARPGAEATVTAREVVLDFDGLRAVIDTPRGPLAIHTALRGRYNLENVLSTIAVGEALALPHEAMAGALANRAPVHGRLEPVEAGQDFPVLIDYAHTPVALEAALDAVREMLAPRDGKLLAVFGCGGDRDTDKREPMGKAVGARADLAIATSDNPRSEDPLAILDAVKRGLDAGGGSYRVVPDRQQAIRDAIAHAWRERPRWAVVVAGKGHEAVQLIGGETLPFSDHDEAARAIERCVEGGCDG